MNKVGVVVVTHGQLATELLNSAEMIVGDLPHFAAVSIGWHDDAAGPFESRRFAEAGTGGALCARHLVKCEAPPRQTAGQSQITVLGSN